MAIEIVSLSEDFVGEVARLESVLISFVSEDKVRKSLELEAEQYFVLLIDGKVCGFLEFSIIPPESELYEIGIAKEFQGKGYSKLLLNYYIDYVKKYDCDTIFLEVNNINEKAINLYKKFGFIVYGERKNYYGKNQDAILMKLKI